MNTYEKAKIIRKFLQETDELTRQTYFEGWVDILNLHKNSNNLSYEFMLEVEKEINSIYNIVSEPKKTKKETRIPALHKTGILCRYSNDNDPVKSPYPRHFLRVNDYPEYGFTDYAITHYDLEIMILDNSAEFVKNEHGNFLDYTKDALSSA